MGYISRFGYESWELDALEPSVLENLVQETVMRYQDKENWSKMVRLENKHKRALEEAANNF